jgi:hypothetical protein
VVGPLFSLALVGAQPGDEPGAKQSNHYAVNGLEIANQNEIASLTRANDFFANARARVFLRSYS